MSSNETPDLATILKTLAGLTPQAQISPQQSQPSLPAPVQQPTEEQKHFQRALQEQLDAHASGGPYAAPTNNGPKLVDPATIIEWETGAKCVRKTVLGREDAVNDIRRMIKVQHEHEEQWWNGREALIERQKARKEGQRKLDEVLAAVGGAISTGINNNGPEELARELQTYDLKVYKAQMQMAREMSAKLKGLGVPFFGTRSELIRGKGESGGGGVSASQDGRIMIDEMELVKLQRKMLEILETLCGD
ncbi:hypothetical protein BGZ60DRAFT_79185 [Tricladium varicosporioides]|nr:hypothetical protein BGZ60DRAFT_79185 [Hymenoscyphus varicosporioides]